MASLRRPLEIEDDMAQRPPKKARASAAPASASSWADLPLDIAGDVLRLLPCYADRICFGAACRSWRSSARQHRAAPRLPCLAFTDGAFRGFPADARPFRLPAAAGHHSSCGEWLVFECHDGAYALADPFSHAAMPRLPRLPRVHVRADPVVAAAERALPDCRHPWREQEREPEPEAAAPLSLLKLVVCSTRLVAAVVGQGRHGKLALCRPGAPSWSMSGDDDQWRRLKDMAFYQGKLYVVDHNEDLFAVTVKDEGEPPALSRLDRVVKGRPTLADTLRRVTLLYLAESGGALLMVGREIFRARMRPGRLARTAPIDEHFTVFRAGFRSSRWKKVRTIGDDRALFLGRWCSRAVLLPEEHRPEWGDRIFFLQDGTGNEWPHKSLSYSLSVYHMQPPGFDQYDWPATWLFPRQGKLLAPPF
ncbi:uncharacterized protein LOC100827489 [Brachypodium distachyon]|nr:uncharacterized protein LOC100827489 [Brachypodium distachyon]|eukprot:XP_024317925.1 uncharacterized protein LOC100827489 [Brachypodium distachyon]